MKLGGKINTTAKKSGGMVLYTHYFDECGLFTNMLHANGPSWLPSNDSWIYVCPYNQFQFNLYIDKYL